MRLHYHTKGLLFFARPKTTDISIIQEVVDRDSYLKDFYTIKKGDTVVDVGAHIGSFSVYAASLGARVISFEAMQGSFDLLQENIDINGFPVEAHHVGVMDHVGTETLHIRERNYGGTSFFIESAITEQVPVITLDNVFDDNHIDHCHFLKLDREDSELPILQAFTYWDKVSNIALEWLTLERRDVLKKLLEEKGFTVTGYGNDTFGFLFAKK